MEIYFSEPIKDLTQFFDNLNNYYNTKYLVSVDLSHFNATEVTSFMGFLSNCNSLKTFIPPKTETNKLTSMQSMFYNYMSLESLDLSNLKTEKVTNMKVTFSGCTSLKLLDLSNLNFNNVKAGSHNNILKNVKAFRYVNLKNFTASSSLDSQIQDYLNNINNIMICGAKTKFKSNEICCNYNIETQMNVIIQII